MVFTLKPMTDDDLDAFFDLMNDPTLSPNTGSVPHPITLEWTRERMQAKRALKREGKGADHGLYYDDVLVGNAGWFTNEDGLIEIGYAIHRDWRGKGLATQAGQMLLALMRDNDVTGPVYAQHFKDNPGSGRVLQKLGFKVVREVETQSAGRDAPAAAYILMRDIGENT